MSERGPEINMSSLESKFTVGKVEKTVEQRIEQTANKIKESGILKKDNFSNEVERNNAANEIIESLGFSSYMDIIDLPYDKLNHPAMENKAAEAFDVLKKSISLAMNSDPELQTRLNLGPSKVAEILPYSWNYPDKGANKRNLSEGVIEVSITNKEILDLVKKLDKMRGRIDSSIQSEKQHLADKMDGVVLELLEMDIPDDKEMELFKVKAYINTEAAILRGGFKSRDNSTNRTDESAVLGGRVEEREVESRKPKYERRPSVPKPGEEGAPGMDDFMYDMKKERFVEMESKNKAIRWYEERPAQWYERMSPKEREIIDIRLKLLNATANKEYLRNRDIEKLRGNVPEITNREFKLLWDEMPGFKEALGFMVKDLCETFNEDGRRLLRFKTNGSGKLNPEIDRKIQHINDYRKEVAAVLKKKGLEEQGATEATSVAVEFLCIGDSFESWDYFRELKPVLVISDKLRTMDHPMVKALGKWGVWKGYNEGGNPNTDDGGEEPFVSGALSSWVLDRLSVEPGFKDRLIDGDLKDLLPRTLCVSMLEATKIGDTNMAMALMNVDGTKGLDWIGRQLKDDDKNLMQSHNDMVQGGDFILNLIKGKIQYSAGKNDAQFISDFIENTSLVRQEPNIPLFNGEGLKALAAVDKPEFFRWSLTIALGFNPFDVNPLPESASLGVTDNSYDIAMQGLIDKLTIRSLMNKDEKKKLYKLFSASSLFESKMARLKNKQESAKRKRR